MEDMEDLFRTNVNAPLRLIQLSLADLAANSGAVIDVTSDAASENYEGWGGYGASKIALEKITSVFSIECPNVRFYSLDPGDMRTDMHQAAFPGEDISDRDEPEVSAPAVIKLALGELPSGRYRAEDLLQS
jgi:NAD(P)-dependent dehydrogenase (short-subunit alcohol dehydrogenase family)